MLQHRQIIVIIEMLEIVHRTVKIDVLIPISISIRSQVIHAAHGDRAGKKIRPPEIHIGRMQGPKGSPAGNNAGLLAGVVLDIRHDFAGNVLVELLMTDRLVTRVHFAVEPALGIDAVDRKHLDFAGIDVRLDHIQEEKSLIFEVICSGSWNEEQGKSKMAIDGDFHFLVKRRTEP